MSASFSLAALPDRALLAVTGPDAAEFLQGLISNEVGRLAAPGEAMLAALLTPQGKYLHDFLVIRVADGFWLEGEAARLDDLKRRLSIYKLRAKVALGAPAPARTVFAAWSDGASGEGPDADTKPEFGPDVLTPDALMVRDPRHPRLGWRIYTATPPSTNSQAADWHRHRMALGIPEGSADMQIDKAILLENGFDELGGVDWKKGCYIGQELTARTKYRGLVKKRLLPVQAQGSAAGESLPAPGTPLFIDGKDVGEMRGSIGDRGLALVRLEALAAQGGAGPVLLHPTDGPALRVSIPDWVRLP